MEHPEHTWKWLQRQGEEIKVSLKIILIDVELMYSLALTTAFQAKYSEVVKNCEILNKDFEK